MKRAREEEPGEHWNLQDRSADQQRSRKRAKVPRLTKSIPAKRTREERIGDHEHVQDYLAERQRLPAKRAKAAHRVVRAATSSDSSDREIHGAASSSRSPSKMNSSVAAKIDDSGYHSLSCSGASSPDHAPLAIPAVTVTNPAGCTSPVQETSKTTLTTPELESQSARTSTASSSAVPSVSKRRKQSKQRQADNGPTIDDGVQESIRILQQQQKWTDTKGQYKLTEEPTGQYRLLSPSGAIYAPIDPIVPGKVHILRGSDLLPTVESDHELESRRAPVDKYDGIILHEMLSNEDSTSLLWFSVRDWANPPYIARVEITGNDLKSMENEEALPFEDGIGKDVVEVLKRKHAVMVGVSRLPEMQAAAAALVDWEAEDMPKNTAEMFTHCLEIQYGHFMTKGCWEKYLHPEEWAFVEKWLSRRATFKQSIKEKMALIVKSGAITLTVPSAKTRKKRAGEIEAKTGRARGTRSEENRSKQAKASKVKAEQDHETVFAEAGGNDSKKDRASSIAHELPDSETDEPQPIVWRDVSDDEYYDWWWWVGRKKTGKYANPEQPLEAFTGLFPKRHVQMPQLAMAPSIWYGSDEEPWCYDPEIDESTGTCRRCGQDDCIPVPHDEDVEQLAEDLKARAIRGAFCVLQQCDQSVGNPDNMQPPEVVYNAIRRLGLEAVRARAIVHSVFNEVAKAYEKQEVAFNIPAPTDSPLAENWEDELHYYAQSKSAEYSMSLDIFLANEIMAEILANDAMDIHREEELKMQESPSSASGPSGNSNAAFNQDAGQQMLPAPVLQDLGRNNRSSQSAPENAPKAPKAMLEKRADQPAHGRPTDTISGERQYHESFSSTTAVGDGDGDLDMDTARASARSDNALEAPKAMFGKRANQPARARQTDADCTMRRRTARPSNGRTPVGDRDGAVDMNATQTRIMNAGPRDSRQSRHILRLRLPGDRDGDVNMDASDKSEVGSMRRRVLQPKSGNAAFHGSGLSALGRVQRKPSNYRPTGKPHTRDERNMIKADPRDSRAQPSHTWQVLQSRHAQDDQFTFKGQAARMAGVKPAAPCPSTGANAQSQQTLDPYAAERAAQARKKVQKNDAALQRNTQSNTQPRTLH